MAIKAGNAVLSLTVQVTVCAVSMMILMEHQVRDNISYLYHEEGIGSAFRAVLGYFIGMLFGLPVFFTNYYFTQLCFKSRPLSFEEIAVNILLMAACNALYQIILFKVIAGEPLDIMAISCDVIGMASCFLMELLRYKISRPKAP